MKHVGEGNISSYSLVDKEKCRKNIFAIIVKHNYHFTFIEQEGIMDLLYFLHSGIK